MPAQDIILKQIDSVLEKYHTLASRSQYRDCSDQPAAVIMELLSSMYSTIDRLAPRNSQYVEAMRALIKRDDHDNPHNLAHCAGILAALNAAYAAGYLATVTELIHADI